MTPSNLSTSVTQRTNFHRRVHCILGLPFDALSIEDTETAVANAIGTGQRCFFSTPNLNFLVGCLDDTAFRDSVIRSDLSLADGMPIIWIARMLGIPVLSRVAGSTLFERLRNQVRMPIKVFLFGGPSGVADKAATVLNSDGGMMSCVGAHSPGFGTIEEMSSHSKIDEINAAKPDFLLVALGAKRGQAWIEHNLPRLNAPIVSHLGAVINFVAGTVSRAPAWVGSMGLEWLWRIKEEPALWRRYAHDGFALLNLLATRVIPGALSAAQLRRINVLSSAYDVSTKTEDNKCLIVLSGYWCEKNSHPLREVFQQQTECHLDIQIDLEKVVALDSACIGLLILLFGHQSKIKRGFQITLASPAVKKAIRLSCADFLYQTIPHFQLTKPCNILG